MLPAATPVPCTEARDKRLRAVRSIPRSYYGDIAVRLSIVLGNESL